MIILTLRTDNPEAEIGLYDDKTQLGYETWTAHRILAETIHLKLRDLLDKQTFSLHDLQGIVVYKGPGSFTGLRIGLTVANALANGIGILIVSETGENWQQKGIARLKNSENETAAMPEYGADVHITLPKH